MTAMIFFSGCLERSPADFEPESDGVSPCIRAKPILCKCARTDPSPSMVAENRSASVFDSVL